MSSISVQLVEAFRPVYRSRTIKPNRILSAEADEACRVHAVIAKYYVISRAAPQRVVSAQAEKLVITAEALEEVVTVPARDAVRNVFAEVKSARVLSSGRNILHKTSVRIENQYRVLAS